MPEPASGADAHLDRRHRRNERKRRQFRRVVGIVASTAVFLGFVLLATDVVRFGGDTPSLANTVEAGAGGKAAPGAGTSTTVPSRPCRAISTSDPLRLWVGGDSLAGSLGPALGTIAGATGVVQPYFDSRVSSGLDNPGFFDWPDHASTVLADINPDIVVFIIGANDSAAVNGDNGKAEYTQKVDDMLKVLIGTGRTVYWIGAPILKDAQMDAGVVQVNAIAAAEVALHPEAQYIDAYKLFSDSSGSFSYDLPDATGKVITMRSGDGVHFTPDGADYLANTVYKLVDAQCRVTEQQVAGATLPTIEAQGSTQVAPSSGSGSSGSGSSGSSGSGSSGATVETTPPATAPDTTTPPVTTPAPTTATTPPPATSTPNNGTQSGP